MKINYNLKAILACYFFFVFCNNNSESTFWKKTNGPFDVHISELAVSSKNDIFAKTKENGIFYSKNNGKNWKKIETDIPDDEILSIATHPKGDLYIGSEDGLFNYNNVIKKIMEGRIRKIAIDSKGNIFILNSGELFTSSDNGINWHKIELPRLGLPFIENMIFAFNSKDNIFIGVRGRDNFGPTCIGIIYSDDECKSWKYLGHGGGLITSMAFNSKGTMFVGSYPGRIARSIINDPDWEKLTFEGTIDSDPFFEDLDFPERSSYSIIINSSDYIYAKGDSIIYRSSDNGNSWDSITSGLKNSRPTCLAINSNGILFAGTKSHGIFRSTKSTIE